MGWTPDGTHFKGLVRLTRVTARPEVVLTAFDQRRRTVFLYAHVRMASSMARSPDVGFVVGAITTTGSSLPIRVELEPVHPACQSLH